MMILLLTSILLASAETNDTAKLSEALGHLLGKHLHDLPLNMEALAKGINDEAEGKSSPMEEERCLEELAALSAQKDREEAEKFLQSNREEPGVHCLMDGKLQYIVVREGTGEPLAAYNSPIVRFKNHPEEMVVLDEAMLGLKLGLEGMREGEIRKLFIHPDLANLAGPLWTEEVELVRADASGDAKSAYERENLPEIPPLR